MVTAGSEHVTAACAAVLEVLQPLVERDWSVRAGDLEWSCAQTAAHMANDVTKYAAQIAGRVDEGYLRCRLVIAPDERPDELLRIVRSATQLLAAAVEVAPDDARAWHWGLTDRSGFAAMGVGELLVHTFDIACGLGVDWRPPPHLAEVVLDRLMPEASAGDASAALLWATGRIELPGRARVHEWVWHPAAVGRSSGGDA